MMADSFEHLHDNDVKTLLRAVVDVRDKAVISLFLNTGLFVNELIDLTHSEINFEGKILTTPGNRTRTIPLNDQAHDALATWTQHRVETPCPNIFVTQKGKVQPLTIRAIDKLIHKQSKQAKFKRKINAKILRNTFAVKLFSDANITIKQAGDVLGISDYDSIKRYQTAAQNPNTHQPLPDLSHTDTRPFISKFFSKLTPSSPKKIKTTPSTIPKDTLTIGRDTLIRDALSNLNKQQSSLLTGPLGFGKTHLINHLTKQLDTTVSLSLPMAFKDMLIKIANAINSDWQKLLGSRVKTPDLLHFVVHTTQSNLPVLVIDNLHKLRVADIESMLQLLENYTVLASTEELTTKLKQLWWKFCTIELKPLSEDHMKTLIQHLTQPLSISDYELLETRLLNQSNGIPLAVVDMIKQLSYENVVSRQVVRELTHEVGVVYRDWTFSLIILWGLVVMSRFIALGSHSFEGYILAGLGTSVLVVARFFMLRMR
jgi:hypothetical protein